MQVNFYKHAQELLQAVCLNCNKRSTQDIETMAGLCKLRIKNKLILNQYMQCMRELAAAHPDNALTLMQHTVHNELSTSRNPNNMLLLGAIINQDNKHACKV